MEVLVFIIAAVCAYLVSGINPAIVLSKAVYKQDIRELGSKNPGFTNFKRVFGGKCAYLVMALDLFKAALLILVFSQVFNAVNGQPQLGAAFTGFFAMLGHCYPVWYGLKGGKGFLVCFMSMWFIDWRAGIIATAILALILFTIKYMSLATICAMLICPIVMIIFGYESVFSLITATVMPLFMTYRHKENIKRLVKGTESKFSFRSQKA